MCNFKNIILTITRAFFTTFLETQNWNPIIYHVSSLPFHCCSFFFFRAAIKVLTSQFGYLMQSTQFMSLIPN